MYNRQFCIRLPYLRSNASLKCLDKTHARWLWPGLPYVHKDEGYWYEAQFPFSGEAALSILEEMRCLDPESMLQMLHMEQDNKRQLRIQAELHAIKNFAEEKPLKPASSNPGKEQAQKILLWRWLQESLWQELQRLNDDFMTISKMLKDNIGEDTDVHKREEPGELPEADWKIILAHALCFIPADIPLLAEGPMAREIGSTIKFDEDAELAEELNFPQNGKLGIAHFAPKEILTRNLAGNILDNVDLGQNRLWLLWDINENRT